MTTPETAAELLHAAVETGAGLAIYKLPDQPTVHWVFAEIPVLVETVIESSERGFVVAPFKGNGSEWFIAAQYYGTLTESAALVAETALPTFNVSLAEAKLPIQPPQYHADEKYFIALVEKATTAIVAGHFRKVVTSRCEALPKPATFKPITYLQQLCQLRPEALVSLVYLPNEGLWIGASPEILVELEHDRRFATVSLAGTQPAIAGKATRAAQWGQKEIEEQALVSRYIINCFKKVRVREYDDVGPRTVQAGNLWHLQTDFSVDLSEVRYPNFATEMLLLLHPTSAVCGMPKKPALAFLEEHEQYNRRLYSGYLGPVNVNDYTRLHVNLRCMQVTQNELLFYIGGGITADSDPQREWQETQHKRRSLWPL